MIKFMETDGQGHHKDINKDDLIYRMDGRIEWCCEHGVGHTIYNPHDWGKYSMSHGCDGCCSRLKKIG